MIGQKNGRLYSFVERHRPARPMGTAPKIKLFLELERERCRIGRELHAGAGQPLAGIKLNLEMLGKCSGDLPLAGREALTRLQKLAEQALEQVRAVSHSLHPPEWQGLTAAEALRYLVESSGLTARLDMELNIQTPAEEPSHLAKVALYRCAQECISNVLRHSGATHLSIGLSVIGTNIELRVEDNGHGFFEESAGKKGIGLVAMREHAESLDGTCDILSHPLGVTVVIRLPFEVD
jgi:signal transduction histidine kinase